MLKLIGALILSVAMILPATGVSAKGRRPSHPVHHSTTHHGRRGH